MCPESLGRREFRPPLARAMACGRASLFPGDAGLRKALLPQPSSSDAAGAGAGGKTPAQGAEIIVPWALLGPDEKNKTCQFVLYRFTLLNDLRLFAGLFWSPGGEFAW